MLFKDLLLQCNVEKITREIMKLSEASESDYNQILKRYKILIDELIAREEYTVTADKNFCFVAVPIENCSEKIKKTHNTDVYVSLYSMDNIIDPYNTQIPPVSYITIISRNTHYHNDNKKYQLSLNLY